MTRARLIAPLRPDKYLRIAAAMQRENMGIASGFASAAQRCPDRPGLIDELDTLTWREIDQRADALAAALHNEATSKVIGIMARIHRGFVEALIAANRIGPDVLLLNTSFAAPAPAEVVERERVDTVIYDEEFTATAFVVLNDGGSATPEGLQQYVRENLANYKVPREITILDELPRNSTGKIVRRELQERVDRA